MASPRWKGSWFEYVELYNSNDTDYDLTGHSFTIVGSYNFPSGSSIPAGGYVVIAIDPAKLIEAYPHLSPSQVYGPLSDSLPRSGRLVKFEGPGGVIAQVQYAVGWSYAAGGIGASLELICHDPARQNDRNAWAASPVPVSIDYHEEFGGTPGVANTWNSCFTTAPTKPKVTFHEIMYRPLTLATYEEIHEFIEIYNEETTPVDISHWRVVAERVRFRFPPGSIIQPGAIVILAKDAQAFSDVYNLTADYAGYTGVLSNGNEELALIDSNGFVVDFVDYSDGGDWPNGADGAGASEAELPADHPNRVVYNFTLYSPYSGMSLQRRSFAWPSDVAYNWEAAIPTPGVVNVEAIQPALPIGSPSIDILPNLITNTSNPKISLRIRPWPITGLAIANVTMTYYRDDVIFGTAPTPITVEMIKDGTDTYSYVMPAFENNSIIRYKFETTFTDNRTMVTPRISDPFYHYSYFINPPPAPTGTQEYHLFISRANWGKIIANAHLGRSNGCFPRDTWPEYVPAVVVYAGEVADIRVRLQGSRYNRNQGEHIQLSSGGDAVPVEKRWPYFSTVGPTSTSADRFKAYSYKFNLPRYAKIKDRGIIILHKMYQGCAFYTTPLMHGLAEEVNILQAQNDYARLNVNGHYLRWMLELRHQDDTDYIVDARNERCWHQAWEYPGHYYKMSGYGGSEQEGPYGVSDFRVMTPNTNCPQYSVLDRYNYNFGLSNYEDFRDASEIYNLTLDLQYARNTFDINEPSNLTALREFMLERVDYDLLMSYTVLHNYAGTWDQRFHNQYVYRNLQTGRYSLLPWDADLMFGENRPGFNQTTATIYLSSRHDNNGNSPQYLRWSFIDAFKNELDERFRLFLASYLSYDNMIARINAIRDKINPDDIAQSYGKFPQNLDTCYNIFSSFARNRLDIIHQRIGEFNSSLYNNKTALEILQDKSKICPDKPTITRLYNTYRSVPGNIFSINAQAVSHEEVLVSWAPPFNGGHAVTYHVEISLDGSNWTSLSNETNSSLSVPSEPVTTYHYRVRASNSLGESALWSPVATATTPPIPPSTPPSTPPSVPSPEPSTPPPATDTTPTDAGSLTPDPSLTVPSLEIPEEPSGVPSDPPSVSPTESASSLVPTLLVTLALLLLSIAM